MWGFPLEVVNLANTETLQYLLDNVEGKIVPSVTSVFWADNTKIYYNKEIHYNFDEDMTLLSNILLPEEAAIAEWIEYYEMNDDSVKLLKFLLSQKSNNFTGKIVLYPEHKKLIPGDEICDGCIESLMELNIYL